MSEHKKILIVSALYFLDTSLCSRSLLTSEPLQPLFFALLANDEEQRHAHGDQDHRGANGEELLHVVVLLEGRLDGWDCACARQQERR